MRKRWMKAAALMLSAAMVLSSCGKSTDASAAQTTAAQTAAAAAAETAAAGGSGAVAGTEGAVKAAPAAEKKAAKGDTWTVMFYLDGTDLETGGSSASDNIREVLETNPSEKVNFVIQTGGAESWNSENLGVTIDPGKLQRFSYSSTGLELVDEQPLAPMSDGKTLTSFIQFCAEKYPAERYMLIVWDHGGGTAGGLIVDELHDNSTMSTKDWIDAIKASGVHFDTVLTDMCLMGSLECAQGLAPYADYYFASEETMAGGGTAYTEWLQYLYENSGCTTEQFAKVFCNSFQRKYKSGGSSFWLDTGTISVIDLSKIGAVADAEEALFAEINSLSGDVANLTALAYAVNKADTFSYGSRNLFGMVDLVDFAMKAREAGISPETVNGVVNAVNDAVVCKVNGSEHSFANGISFFYMPEAYDPSLFDTVADLITSPSLLAYYDTIREDWKAPDWVYEKIPKPEAPDRTGLDLEYELEYSDNLQPQIHITGGLPAVTQIDAQFYWYYPEQEQWYLLGTDFALYGEGSDGVFTASFDGSWYSIDDIPVALQVASETDSQINFDIPVSCTINDETMYGKLRAVFHYNTPLDQQESADLDFTGWFEVLGINWQSISTPGMPSRTTISLVELKEMDATLSMLGPLCDQEYDLDQAVSYGEIKAEPIMGIGGMYLAEGDYAVSFEIHDVFGNRRDTTLVPIRFDGENTITVPD